MRYLCFKSAEGEISLRISFEISDNSFMEFLLVIVPGRIVAAIAKLRCRRVTRSHATQKQR